MSRTELRLEVLSRQLTALSGSTSSTTNSGRTLYTWLVHDNEDTRREIFHFVKVPSAIKLPGWLGLCLNIT